MLINSALCVQKMRSVLIINHLLLVAKALAEPFRPVSVSRERAISGIFEVVEYGYYDRQIF